MASKFKLHGASKSTCTRRVALIAKERNIQYELIPVDFTVAEHKQPPHLQHQPFGQVPYITVRHFPLPYLMRCSLMRIVSFFIYLSVEYSKMTDSICSSRVLSVATSRPLALGRS